MPRSTARAFVVAILVGLACCACGPTPAAEGTTGPATTGPAAAATGPSASPSASTSGSPSSTGGDGAGQLPGEPDSGLTPGIANPEVTQADIGSTICVSGWTATVRPPSSYTTDLKRTQITEYGYTDTALADYEEDHLISLEIGGDPTDPRNLWPEPYAATLSDGRDVGARVKDQFENRLHDLVCNGSLPLASAQAEIAHDWITNWFALDGQPPPPGGVASPVPGASTAPPTAGGIRVVIASLTSPVRRGHVATLRATTLARAACSIVVRYRSGPSHAAGLVPKTASSSGAVAWSWTVGTSTTPGSWPVTVTCSASGATGSATRSFTVV